MSDPAAAEYPEFLADLSAQFTELLVSRGIARSLAADLGREAADLVRARWGGIEVYVPKGRSFMLSQRDREIWEKWNGRNVVELCREYGLSEQRIYQILDAMREQEAAKRQHKLFGD